MCLTTEKKEGLISDKPVTCYKLYFKHSDGALLSYYQHETYNLKEGDDVVAEGEGDIITDLMSPWIGMLGKGYIHGVEKDHMLFDMEDRLMASIEKICYHITRFQNADLNFLNVLLDDMLNKMSHFCLCEMEIPAGERYWVGRMRENGVIDICARRMIFKREIKFNKSKLLEKLYQLHTIYDWSPEENEVWWLPLLKKQRWDSVMEKYKAKGE